VTGVRRVLFHLPKTPKPLKNEIYILDFRYDLKL